MDSNIYALLKLAWAVSKSQGANVYGVEIGIVTNVKDPDKQGRVKVCFPRLQGNPESDWARVAQPSAGDGRGFYWLPHVNDEVLVAFERGQANCPYVIGSLWNGKDKPMKAAYTDENTIAMIQTKSGHQIALYDKAGEEKITIGDKSGKRTVTFDVKNKKFLIEAKEGDLELHMEKKFVIDCEDLEIKTSKTGKADIGTTFDLKVSQKAQFKAGPQMNLKASKVQLNPSSFLDVILEAAEMAARAVANAAAAAAAEEEEQQAAGAGGAGGAAGGGALAPGQGGGDLSSEEAGPAAGEGALAKGEQGEQGGSDDENVNAGAGAAPASAASTPINPADLDVQLVDANGDPQKNLEVEITLPDGDKRAGKTGDDGHFKLEKLTVTGNAKLEIPDVQVAPQAPASAPGRIRFVQGGVQVPIGQSTVVELPPRVRRCRMRGMHFETAKTFLLPSAMTGIRQLVRLYKSFEGIVGLVNGHTDRQGSASFNLGLSVERADSIKAFLLDDAETWMQWYRGKPFSDRWGIREDKHMLSSVKDASGAPFFAGKVDGALTQDTRDAYRRFQEAHSLNGSGVPDDKTRLALVKEYMASEGTSLESGSQLTTHGCGLSHPLPETAGDPNPDQPANRRVEVFLFEKEIEPKPQTPCPSGGCTQYQQWVDHKILDVDLDQPPGALRVKVIDGAGQVIAGADVHAAGPLSLDGTTGADGFAAFDEVIPGSYRVVADKAGFSAADSTVDVPAGSGTAGPADSSTGPARAAPATAREVDLTLQAATGDLVVTVNDAASQPISGARLIVQDSSSGATVGDQTTPASGTVTFAGLAAGSVSVGASAPGFSPQTVTGQVRPAQSNPLAMTLARATGSLTVHVVDSLGAAVSGATVNVKPATGTAPAAQPTDASGNATFTGLEVGTAQISATRSGFTGGPSTGTVVAGSTVTVNVTLIATVGDLDVHVTNSVGGRNLAGATVALSGGILSATTDAQGLAHFSAISAGSFTATVTLQNFATGTQPVQVRTNQSNLLNVALTPSIGNLEVDVVDTLGAAVTGASVTVTPSSGPALAPAATDNVGRAGFTSVPVGNVSVRVQKAPAFQDGAASVTITPAGLATVNVTLQRASVQLTVTVKSSTGANLVGALATIAGPASVNAVTDANGRVQPNLLLGTYQVSASLDNFTAPAPQTVALTGAGTNAITITLTPNPVAATIAPKPLVAVLKKHNCNPARVPITLRTANTFTGTGTGRFQRSKPTVRFFTAANGGTEITFNGTDNVFTAAQLAGAAGIQLFAEGGTVSSLLEDTDLSLDLFVGTNAFGTPGTAKATVVDLTLEVFQSRTARGSDPAPMAVNAKTDTGRFVHVQDPGFHHLRAWLVVREVAPAGFTQDLELRLVPPTGGGARGAVQLFRTEGHVNAESAVGLPFTIAAADFSGPLVAGRKGVRLFVEGQTVSNGLRDIVLQLGIRGGEADGDRGAFTVVRLSNLKVTIPSTAANTPRNAVGPGPLRNNNNPVPASTLTLGTGAAPTAREYDELFANNAPIVLIENSIAAATPIVVDVNVAPAGVPVKIDTQRAIANVADKDNDNIVTKLVPAPSPQPLCTQISNVPPLRANLIADSVGSFHLRGFVDCNGGGNFGDLDEPYIVMNFIMVRVQGDTNRSTSVNTNWGFATSGTPNVPPGSAFSASQATGLTLSTGGFANAAQAATHNDATVNLIGGGPTGVAGLDQVFLGWVNNELDAATPTRPNASGEDVISSYLDTTGPVAQTHTQISVWVVGGGQFRAGTAVPALIGGPVLDTSFFGGNEGVGGNSCVGTEGLGPGPPIAHAQAAPIGTPGNVGKSIQVEMWDSPGDDAQPAMLSLPGVLQNYHFNIDFRSDLVVWTNIVTKLPAPSPGLVNSPTATAPDPACCLYSTVQTNLWSIRFAFVFGPAPVPVPVGAVAMTKDADPKRLARAIAGGSTEVRFPIDLRLLGTQERP